MDLNDYVPVGCMSNQCREKTKKFTADNIQFYKPSEIPEVCPKCGQAGMLKQLEKVCIAQPAEKGNYKATRRAQKRTGKPEWIMLCAKARDEYNIKVNIPKHTVTATCATCPECLIQYNKELELANQYLRVKE